MSQFGKNFRSLFSHFFARRLSRGIQPGFQGGVHQKVRTNCLRGNRINWSNGGIDIGKFYLYEYYSVTTESPPRIVSMSRIHLCCTTVNRDGNGHRSFWPIVSKAVMILIRSGHSLPVCRQAAPSRSAKVTDLARFSGLSDFGHFVVNDSAAEPRTFCLLPSSRSSSLPPDLPRRSPRSVLLPLRSPHPMPLRPSQLLAPATPPASVCGSQSTAPGLFFAFTGGAPTFTARTSRSRFQDLLQENAP